MKIVLFNRDTLDFEQRDIPREDSNGFLDLCYEFIGCEYIDRAHVISDATRGLVAWVDDMGMYQKPKTSLVGEYPQPLHGSIVFTGPDNADGYSDDIAGYWLEGGMERLRATIMPLLGADEIVALAEASGISE